MYRKLLLILIVFAAALSCTRNAQQNSYQKTPYITGETLFSDDFSGDLTNWITEGVQPVLAEKQLELDTPVGTTVWFKPQLEGDVMIEYDVTALDDGGPNDRISDLNCFWMATDPAHPNNLFAANKERGGTFANYNNLNQYYVGYGGNTNTTTRFRRYNNGDRKLLGEFTDTSHLIVPNHQYHIQLICYGNKIEYYRDGECLFSYEDPQPYRKGHFGLRTTLNHLVMDNFRVLRILSTRAD
ncbi:MAG: DUF6250 domain-containing protein [Sedimentisphaerales bacterium]